MLPLSRDSVIYRRRVESLHDFAAENSAAFAEIYPAGEPFSIPPPHIVGPNDARTYAGEARSFFVTCLADATIRWNSGYVEVGNKLLRDYQGDELNRIDDRLDLDHYVFHTSGSDAWLISDQHPVMEIDEAFVGLIGHTDYSFGEWLWQYLPKYITAVASGALPLVPVLIDAGMPNSHVEALEFLLPKGVDIIEVPGGTAMRVHRLWNAPTLFYRPILEHLNAKFTGFDYLCTVPSRYLPALAEMQTRANRAFPGNADAGARVYIARTSALQRKLLNSDAVEEVARTRGFRIVYPEKHSFFEQVRLVHDARFILGPNGSALYLAFFARAGTKLCALNHPSMLDALTSAYLFEEIGIDLTLFTGPAIRLNNEPGFPNFGFPQYADYEIDVDAFSRFLDEWLAFTSH